MAEAHAHLFASSRGKFWFTRSREDAKEAVAFTGANIGPLQRQGAITRPLRVVPEQEMGACLRRQAVNETDGLSVVGRTSANSVDAKKAVVPETTPMRTFNLAVALDHFGPKRDAAGRANVTGPAELVSEILDEVGPVVDDVGLHYREYGVSGFVGCSGDIAVAD